MAGFNYKPTRKSKSRRNTRGKPSASVVAHSLTVPQKMEVKKLIAPKIETKYVSDDENVNDINPITISSSISTIGDYNSVVPTLLQGTAQNQRIGNSVSDCKIHCKWNIFLDQSTAKSYDYSVKIFLLESKRIKSENVLAGGADPGPLLNAGNGTSINWLDTNPNISTFNDFLPVNTEDWTVKKIFKRRLVKNNGTQNYDANTGNVPNVSSPHAQSSFGCVIKVPKMLYNNDDSFPSNHTYVWYAVYWLNSNGSINSDGNVPPKLQFASQMYYKDG